MLRSSLVITSHHNLTLVKVKSLRLPIFPASNKSTLGTRCPLAAWYIPPTSRCHDEEVVTSPYAWLAYIINMYCTVVAVGQCSPHGSMLRLASLVNVRRGCQQGFFSTTSPKYFLPPWRNIFSATTLIFLTHCINIFFYYMTPRGLWKLTNIFSVNISTWYIFITWLIIN